MIPRDDFRVQTFEMPDGQILMRLTGMKSGQVVEAEHAATGMATLISLARLWLRAGGVTKHAIQRWLQFTEILFASAPSSKQPLKNSDSLPVGSPTTEHQ